MKRLPVRFALLLLVVNAASFVHAQFKMPSLPGSSATSGSLGNGLDDSQIASGLKDALSVGTKKAVTLVDHPGGYLENEAIKILLPKNLQPVEKMARSAGQGPKIDQFVASMNHAAESAAPEAEGIFATAVKEMSIDDARKLLNGGDTSITDYFKSKTSDQLRTAFQPHVKAAMDANGVTDKYQALQAQAPKISFLGGSDFDINKYVLDKALDGLFYMLAQQEKDIRSNPAARTTGLLKSVFGR